MQKILAACPLFAGIRPGDLDALCGCLSAARREYADAAYIFMAGESRRVIGIVLKGGARIVQEDFWGRRSIIGQVRPGQLVVESFSCAGAARLPFSVVAVGRTELMFLDYKRIAQPCSSACHFHSRLIMNMLRILAEKNVLLATKIEHLSRRTTREKLLAYLSTQVGECGGSSVEIPFNRQELADYLCVDRSALSRELGQMRAAGLLACRGRRFTLLAAAESE